MLTRLGTPQLLVATASLAAAGLVMVYSASALRAELLFGNPAVYLLRQTVGLVIGVALALLIVRAPLGLLRRCGMPAWALTTLLIAATLTPLGLEENGARRWLALGPLTFQPLELANAQETQRFVLDAATLSNGLYLWRVRGNTFTETRLVTLVK